MPGCDSAAGNVGFCPGSAHQLRGAGRSLQAGQTGPQENEVRGEVKNAQPGAQPATDFHSC